MSSPLAWYRYRNFSLMVLLLAAGNTCKISCQPVRINEQLIQYLPFNGNSIDATGNGNNATVYGATFGEDRHGDPSGACYFDGIDDYIDLSDDFDYPERSICLWFKAFEIPAWIPGNKDASLDILYTSDHPGLQHGLTKIWLSELNGTDRIFFHNGGADDIADYAFEMIPGEWNFAAVTVTPLMIHYYLNGEHVGSRVFPGNIHSVDPSLLVNAALGIGRMLDHRYYNGAIDDIYIYNRAITACEVLYLYNGNLPDER